MKMTFLLLVAAAALLITGFVNYQQEDEHPGKKVFIDSNCNTCHTVESENIDLKKAKKTSVDLSGVGIVYKTDFLEKYLKKEEKIKDKSHTVAFKGTDEQFEQLVEWLGTLKQENHEGMKNNNTGDREKMKQPENKDEEGPIDQN